MAPNTLDDPSEGGRPTLLPAPPAETDELLTALPAEPPLASAAGPKPPVRSPASAIDSATDVPAEPKRPANGVGPGWKPSNLPTTPNARNGLSGGGLGDLEKELNGNGGETRYCLSTKDIKPISKLSTDITSLHGELPKDCPWGNDRRFTARAWHPLTYTWTASALCHKPLYFDDEHLERYGHMLGPWLQPIVSHGRFFVNVLILPYEMGLEPPNECMYALGYYRPGSCAPYYLDPIPLSVRASLFEASAWTAGAIIIP